MSRFILDQTATDKINFQGGSKHSTAMHYAANANCKWLIAVQTKVS